MEEEQSNKKDKLELEYSGKNRKFKFIYEGLGKTLFGVLIILSALAYCIYTKSFQIKPIAYSLLGVVIICGYLTIQKKF